jgi:hypothetical protein
LLPADADKLDRALATVVYLLFEDTLDDGEPHLESELLEKLVPFVPHGIAIEALEDPRSLTLQWCDAKAPVGARRFVETVLGAYGKVGLIERLDADGEPAWRLAIPIAPSGDPGAPR